MRILSLCLLVGMAWGQEIKAPMPKVPDCIYAGKATHNFCGWTQFYDGDYRCACGHVWHWIPANQWHPHLEDKLGIWVDLGIWMVKSAPVLSAPLPDRIASASGSGTVTNTWSPAETYEPMDVPAIQEPTRFVTDPICKILSGHQIGSCWLPSYWTCADKSRVLETAEDGKKWCHKTQR
jgi:hypothetical protein